MGTMRRRPPVPEISSEPVKPEGSPGYRRPMTCSGAPIVVAEGQTKRPGSSGGGSKEGTDGQRLSFVDCTLEQVQASILAEDKEMTFNTVFWRAVLTGQPSPKFKPLRNRTLEFWVDCFNKWQEERRAKKKDASSGVMNAAQFQQMVYLSRANLVMILELFNPEGAKALGSEGNSHGVVSKITVPMMEILAAGVLTSGLIATGHKVKFLLGLVDYDDVATLGEEKFEMLIKVFIRGLGLMFGVPRQIIPTDAVISKVARRCHARIGSLSDATLTRLPSNESMSSTAKPSTELGETAASAAAGGSLSSRSGGGTLAGAPGAALARAQSNGSALGASMTSKPSSSSALGCSSSALGSSQKRGHAREARAHPYEIVSDWCIGAMSEEDPLAVPFRLAIQRFCPARYRDVSDEFEDSMKNFALSHSVASEMPTMTKTPSGCKVMTRKETLLARDLFEYAKRSGNFRIDPEDRELGRMMQLRNWRVDSDVNHHLKRKWYLEALAKLGEVRERKSSAGDRTTFFDYLRALCPHALPKHLRMYELWCVEFDTIKEDQEKLLSLKEARDAFVEQQKKPFLPEEQVTTIKRQFADMDFAKTGLITRDDVIKGLSLSAEEAAATFDAFDTSCDGFIDEHEFLRMMCPPEYRLKEMGGRARDIFGRILIGETERRDGKLEDLQSKYLATPKGQGAGCLKAPLSALPEAPEEVQRHWNEVFDNLDTNGDNRLTVKDLERSGLLSSGVCRAVVGLIDPSDPDGFSREAFLESIATCNGYRFKRCGLFSTIKE